MCGRVSVPTHLRGRGKGGEQTRGEGQVLLQEEPARNERKQEENGQEVHLFLRECALC